MVKKLLLVLTFLLLLFSGAEGQEGAIKIGTLVPLTGWGAPYGARLQKAYAMAVDEINARGGIQGRPLELVVRDSQSKTITAARETRKLINQDRVLALVGGWSSDIAWTMAQIAQDTGVPYLLDHPSWDRLTRQGFSFVFRLQPTWGMYPWALEDFLLKVVYPQENRRLKVAYLYIDNPFALSVWEYGLKPFFKKNSQKFELVMVEPYQGVALDFRILLLKVKATHPDLVILTSFLEDAALLAREAREVGVYPLLFAGVGGGHFVKEFIQKAEDAGEGYFVSAPWKGEINDPRWKAWAQKWQAMYGQPPGEMEAEAYSAIQILARALEKVNMEGNLEETRREIARALARTDMETIFGHVKFENFNGYTHQNRAWGLTALYQWQERALYQVWPPRVSERPFIYPFVYRAITSNPNQSLEEGGTINHEKELDKNNTPGGNDMPGPGRSSPGH